MGTGYAKISITLPTPLLERIKARVGARGLSGYIADALEAEERRAGLRQWLAEQETEFGPIPDSVLEETGRQWLARGADRERR